jgi:hypothetical protein
MVALRRTLLWRVVTIDCIDGVEKAAEDVAVAGHVVSALYSRCALTECELDKSFLTNIDELTGVVLRLGWVTMTRSVVSWGTVLSWGMVGWSLRDCSAVNYYSLLSWNRSILDGKLMNMSLDEE